jgi:hypothetical protein
MDGPGIVGTRVTVIGLVVSNRPNRFQLTDTPRFALIWTFFGQWALVLFTTNVMVVPCGHRGVVTETVYVPGARFEGIVTVAENVPSGPTTAVPSTIDPPPPVDMRIVTVSPG